MPNASSMCCGVYRCARLCRPPTPPCALTLPQDSLTVFAVHLSVLTGVCLAGHVVALTRGLVPGQNLDYAAQALWFLLVFSVLLLLYDGWVPMQPSCCVTMGGCHSMGGCQYSLGLHASGRETTRPSLSGRVLPGLLSVAHCSSWGSGWAVPVTASMWLDLSRV